MKAAIPLALFALALGVGVGVVLSRDRAAGPAAAPTFDPVKGAAEPPRAGDSERLSRLESEVGALRAEVDRLKAPAERATSGDPAIPDRTTTAAGKETIAALLARVPELQRTRDAAELLRIIKELSKLGDAGCAAAAEIAQALWKAVYDDSESGWGVDDDELERALFSGPMVPLMLWAIRNPDKLEESFRQGAAYGLEDMPGIDPAFVRDALFAERDPMAASSLADMLVREETPQSIQDLAAAARAQAANPEVIERLMWSFWRLKTPEAVRALEDLAQSSDPGLRGHARTALAALDPPTGSLFVAGVWAVGGKSPKPELRRGDLVLSVDGLDDVSKLQHHLSLASPEEWISIRVRRGEAEETIRVKGQSLQFNTLPPRR